MQDALDQLLTAGVGPTGVAGVAAVVVDAAGERYRGAFGERQLGSGQPMTPDTVGWIASMTKPLTGTAAMQLVEQGVLDLEAPASEVCPELGELVVLDGFDESGDPVTRAPKQAVTLRHLLTHTSGFVYDVWNHDLRRYLAVTAGSSTQQRTRASLQAPLLFDPGTRWEYGIGIDWVGFMIEAATGLSLGRYLAANVTGPLAMADTAYAPTPSMGERLAAVHARGDDGTLGPTDLGRPETPGIEPGGGGLLSTVVDYGRFIRMILNDGELDGARIVSADTVDAMATNAMGELRVAPLLSGAPALSNDAEFFPGDPKSWGLTFQINEVAGHTGRSAGTLMWAGLSNCYFWIDRAQGLGGAYLTQTLPFADPTALGLFYDFEAAVYGSRR